MRLQQATFKTVLTFRKPWVAPAGHTCRSLTAGRRQNRAPGKTHFLLRIFRGEERKKRVPVVVGRGGGIGLEAGRRHSRSTQTLKESKEIKQNISFSSANSSELGLDRSSQPRTCRSPSGSAVLSPRRVLPPGTPNPSHSLPAALPPGYMLCAMRAMHGGEGEGRGARGFARS